MEVTETDYRKGLQAFIQEELLAGGREVGFDDELLMDGTVDSVGAVRLVAHVEQTFGIRIPPQDFTIENFQTINALANYLAR